MHLLCFWFYSRMGDAGRIQYFIFLFLMWIMSMRRRGEFKISLSEIGNVLWKRTVGVCLDCVWNLQPQVDITSDFMTLKFEVGASNQKSYLYWSPNFAPDDLTSTDKGWKWGPYWVNVSPGPFSGVGLGWRWAAEIEYTFLEDRCWDDQKRFYFTKGSVLRVYLFGYLDHQYVWCNWSEN